MDRDINNIAPKKTHHDSDRVAEMRELKEIIANEGLSLMNNKLLIAARDRLTYLIECHERKIT